MTVENRAGANGLVAAESMVRGLVDGATVFQCAAGLMAITPEVPGARLPIDPATDMVALANVAESSLALVVPPDSPLRSVADLVAAAGQRPGHLTYASARIASTSHVAAAQMARRAGVALTHVPYRGSALGVLDVVGGRVDLMLTNIGDVMRQVRGGQSRLLAVGDTLGQAPFRGAPLLSIAVPGYEARFWMGICGPRGMPDAAVRRLQEAVRAALRRPEMLRRLRGGGLAPRFEDAAAFARTVATDRRMWRDLVHAADIRAE